MRKLSQKTIVKKKKKRMNAQSNIEIPKTEEEFEKLDFGTRCAVVGLQLGRTRSFFNSYTNHLFLFLIMPRISTDQLTARTPTVFVHPTTMEKSGNKLKLV